ncbi:hypothetical protein M0R04_14335 [Candidatus Dojkabacteria bacterium]|jgi:hypothetical protein|nr:hypothetical protein [Candidatus Dojkabacteria bacterium]
MKIKQIKALFRGLYLRGVYDGIDITKGKNDRFFGNAQARQKWEDDILKQAFWEFKEAFGVSKVAKTKDKTLQNTKLQNK